MDVSIVIPTFNYDKYVARAIRSCLEQSFPKQNYEIIVVNDSSRDSTKYILESYGHWIKVIEHQDNMGLPFSRNQGIRKARGKFIVNLDADDYLHRDFINFCYLYLTFNKVDAVASDYYLVEDNELIIKRINVNEEPIACGIMFRKGHMLDVGLYDPELKIGEDIDFRLRFEKKYQIKRIDLPLYRYRMHKQNLTIDEEKNRTYLDAVEEKNNCKIKHSYHSSKLQNDSKPEEII